MKIYILWFSFSLLLIVPPLSSAAMVPPIFLYSGRPRDIGSAHTHAAHFCEIVAENRTLRGMRS